jgi:hypothetical protein
LLETEHSRQFESQISQLDPFKKYPGTHEVQFIPVERHPWQGLSQETQAAPSKYSVEEQEIQVEELRWNEAAQLVQVVEDVEQFEQGGVHGSQAVPFNQYPFWQDVQVAAAVEQPKHGVLQKSQTVPSKNWFDAHETQV